MEQMCFSLKWRKWINGCLNSAFGSVLVNGSPTKEFKFKKGLRQGESLSPFLFILTIEALHITLQEAKQKYIFEGIKVGSNLIDVSHFQFADDALILGKWSIENAKNLFHLLRCFHMSSGLKVNFNKSKFFSVGVNDVQTHNFASILCCQPSTLPCTYLGLPLGSNMNKSCNWKPILDKFHKRLTSWRSRNISYGGRLTLLKSVLGALGTYFFSLFKAPKCVINNLEKLRRNFFWGGSLVCNKMAWIVWNEVCSPSIHGGLRIGSLHASNMAMLGLDMDSVRCLICDDAIETAQHLFIDCIVAKSLWSMVTSWWGFKDYPKDLDNLLSWADSLNLTNPIKVFFDTVIQTTVGLKKAWMMKW
ncbi:putative RNA-directed DNA polymerase, eukaryota, reverse transcriptase zinc-binding domain protein [Tanacetum coccineum]|uniref:RNA-directed DNA polymerase, eukaryota, reverse transcriptase zinc-binding domain protein n=1 Tax=Tanacetum coccineum TaxID=301880 RepID=A0ABQ5H8I8_9ASTR